MSDGTASGVHFPTIEKEVLAFWEQEDVFARVLEASKEDPVYNFYDGPPFATGLPHHGHLLASTIKDIIPRYFTMKGHFVERRFGWDCHGLPIEYEVDKLMGKSTAQIVEEQGVSAYNDACRGIVQRYVSQWRSTVSRLGRWVDFDNDYKTMDTDFMESVWWVFKQLWEKDLVYQGTKVVPFSTALGTALSNFEASSNYQNLQDPSLTVLFDCPEKASYLAIWTTTPWTLVSNLGICAGPDIAYVKVGVPGFDRPLILAEARLGAYKELAEAEVLERFSGKDLQGTAYQPLFDYFADEKQNGAFVVHVDEFVSTDNGTGLVHMAPAFGEDDHRVMQAAGVKALVCPIDDAGRFTDLVPEYLGDYIKDADKKLIKLLKEQGRVLHFETFEHAYPCCPRSDTPLIYRIVPSWYVRVESFKDRLIKANEAIAWVPEHIQSGRFGRWLEGARDWAISRNRVWGTPLPIWINDVTGRSMAFGSRAELQAKTGVLVEDLHRDHVDELTFEMPGEDGVYRRVPEVLDCWFESGSMPYAQKHYPFEGKEAFEASFPANFIAEGVDQTRGWFYTLTVLAVALFDQPAFKNVIVNGIVLAKDGKKMSKRLKNYTAPDELMERYGADALRLYLIHSGLVKGEEQRFDDEGVRDMVRRTLLPWYHAFQFFKTYADVDQWQDTDLTSSDNALDQWIFARLERLKLQLHEHMEGYRLYAIVPELLAFIESLTNGYIRMNRDRFWQEGMETDKQQAFHTLYKVLCEFTWCMAPFTPFIAEHLYQALKSYSTDEAMQAFSVHACRMPKGDPDAINPNLEAAVDRLLQIIVMGRQKRAEVKIKVKTPLQALTVIHRDQTLLKGIEALESYIKRELNVKAVRYDTNEGDYIRLYAKANLPVLGKRLGKKMGQYRALIEGLSTEDLVAYEQNPNLVLEGDTFSGDDIFVYREALASEEVVSNAAISIALDTTLSDDLVLEGIAREVINRIQKTRKDVGFCVSDRIHIAYNGDERIVEAIALHRSLIERETLAQSCVQDSSVSEHVFDIDGAGRLSISLSIAK